MRLQGDEGYYAAEVPIEGCLFRYRELTDQEQKRVQEAATAIMDLRRKQAALARRLQAEEDLSDEEFTSMNALGQEALKQERIMYDLIVSAGIVSWQGDGLDGVDCTPENARRLPPQVKAHLAREIGKMTSLSFDEADFCAGQPKQ